ncbi:Plus-3 domain containing protein [Aphelenchoides avenae]|nr:Plus-3 domain containing protein [Aphelenchus avenae]
MSDSSDSEASNPAPAKESSEESSSDSDDDSSKRPARAAAAARKSNVIESGSSDDSDSDEPTTSRKRKVSEPKRKPAKKKKVESEDSDNSDDDDPTKTDYDDLYIDDEDRERLNNMSEKDREIEICKRLEQREILKAREQIKKKLQKQGEKAEKDKTKKPSGSKKHGSDESSEEGELKKGDESDVSDVELSTEFHKPSELATKQVKKNAMQALLSKRKEKKEAEEKRKQEAEKATLKFDEIFGDDDGKSESSSSSSSSSASSSRSSSRSRSASPEAAVKKPVETKEELSRCRLSRFKLAKFVHAPFFAKMAVGCFVRIGIGNKDGRAIYQIAQIVEVLETPKVYEVEKTRTNKGLKLKHGQDSRTYRLEFVSNSDFTDSEFERWIKNMNDNNVLLPTMDQIVKKETDIRNAQEHKFTEADIDFMVKEKAKFSKAPTNFAVRKGELVKEKEYAEQIGDLQRVQMLQQEIDDLDARTNNLDRQRAGALSGVAWINQRNRERMKQSFLTNGVVFEESGSKDDPFTRKSSRMRVVSGVAKKNEATGSQEVTPASAAVSKPIIKSTSTPNFGKSETPGGPSKSGLPSLDDLFSAHNVDIDIPIQLHATPKAPLSSIEPTSTPPASANGSSSRSVTRLTLEEYKRKRGLI